MNKKYKFILISGLLLCCISLFYYKHFYTKATDIDKSIPKISVIVPVYNVEKYLDECLESVENQTLKDIEIICVNDGSTDNSPQILESHKAKDNRIKIINQPNGGVADARNTGINLATGEYIAFLDSDDILVPNAYEVSYENIKNHHADILEYGIYKFSDGDTIDKDQIQYNKSDVNVYVKKEKENPYSALGLHACVIWDKIWKTSLIKDNNLRFAKGIKLGEDTLFDWLAFPLAKKSVRDNNKLYCYRVNRQGSAMNSIKSKKILENYMLIIDELIKYYPERFDFVNSDQSIIDIFLCLTQSKISTIFNKLETKEDKIYFAKAFFEKIESFVNKHKITLIKDHQSKLNELKNLAEGN